METIGPPIKSCPDCGAEIPLDAPDGLCIVCLLSTAQEAKNPGFFVENALQRIVGDYELIREIGRGGMGVVYEARQRRLNRIVALKLILAGEFASEMVVARFVEEAEVIASLDHPNIIPIYEVGEHKGHHFYTMKLIEGQSLAELLSKRTCSSRAAGHVPSGDEPLTLSPPNQGRSKQSLVTSAATSLKEQFTPRAAAALLAKVARALHFVHQRGIIHRDLSPENILLNEQGEPCITDFGMARLAGNHRRLTQTNALVGKPDYMAPEQSDPSGSHTTTASDIFSLGAIFFQLLTGERPFAAATPIATLERTRTSEPIPPSQLNPSIDRDLETICLKCLSKEQTSRYESAAALADDLDRWLGGHPILARPLNKVEVFTKWFRRNPLKAALALVSSIAILGPLIITFYLYHFVLPEQARAHPIIGRDQNVGGFALTFDTGRVDRASMNFDLYDFKKHKLPRFVRIYFTNIPPENMGWVSNLQCQVFGDIPGAPDEPRSPIVRHGDSFSIAKPHWNDRAYYICPFGWQGQDLLARAPNARLCITFLDGE